MTRYIVENVREKQELVCGFTNDIPSVRMLYPLDFTSNWMLRYSLNIALSEKYCPVPTQTYVSLSLAFLINYLCHTSPSLPSNHFSASFMEQNSSKEYHTVGTKFCINKSSIREAEALEYMLYVWVIL